MARYYALALLALAACSSHSKKSSTTGATGDAGVDAGMADGGASSSADSAADMLEASTDGGSVDDSGTGVNACPAENIVKTGCEDLGGKDEHAAGKCDGYDNNCDGVVDELCPCVPGSVQSCFAGPPGRVDTGACRRGTQVCVDSGEFPGWSLCTGGIAPTKEVCDRLDNDCNGCTDELESCDVFIDCPGPNDARVPKAKPFEAYVLDASRFYNGNDVQSYAWTIEGSPCDKLFQHIPGSQATATNGQLSYTLTGADQKRAQARFTLSGTYLVSLKIVRKSGQELGCSFPVVASGPGIRVELCWDQTGPTAAASLVDLDLHFGLKGATGSWNEPSDCYYDSCVPKSLTSNGIWGHDNNPDVSACLTGGDLDIVHQMRGNCINPRIDIDNQSESGRYLPENINLDNPRAGELFEVAVNHKSKAPVRTSALVNVYCGGNLRGSYTLDANKTAFSDATSEDEFWRVVQIAPQVDGAGSTTDCTLTPLHPKDAPSSPLITDGDFSVTWPD